VQIDGSFQETPRRSAVSVRPKQEVDRAARAVNGPVQVFSLAAWRPMFDRRRHP